MRRRCALFLLLTLMAATASELKNRCTAPAANRSCRLLSTNKGDSGVKQLATNESVTWDGAVEPTRLRALYFFKTCGAHDRQCLAVRVQWWLLAKSRRLPRAIDGFLITMRRADNTSFATSHLLQLEKSIETAQELSVQPEFSLELDDNSLEPADYDIEIRIVPLANDTAKSIKKQRMLVAKIPTQANCSTQPAESIRIAAARWAASFTSIRVQSADRALLVAFAAAPKSLCLVRYKVQVDDVRHNTIAVAHVHEDAAEEEADGRRMMRTPFYDLPTETPLVVKVVAEGDSLDECVCADCTCMTVKSTPITVPAQTKKSVEQGQDGSRSAPTLVDNVQLTISSNAATSVWRQAAIPLLLLIVLALSLTVCALILLVLLRRERRRVTRTKDRRQYVLGGAPIASFDPDLSSPPSITRYNMLKQRDGSPPLILIVASAFDAEACDAARRLHCLLRAQGARVRSTCDQEDELECNVGAWARKYVSEAKTIVLLHSVWPEEDVAFGCTIALLDPLDERIIHIRPTASHPLCWTSESSWADVVYVIPRDVALLLAALHVPAAHRSFMTAGPPPSQHEGTAALVKSPPILLVRHASFSSSSSCSADPASSSSCAENAHSATDPSTGASSKAPSIAALVVDRIDGSGGKGLADESTAVGDSGFVTGDQLPLLVGM